MSEFRLLPHPDIPAARVKAVAATLRRTQDVLTLAYRVEGAAAVRWPTPAAPDRTEGLWRTTCFELFLRFDDGERYVEFNFSPSTQWAAYAFDGYREGMADLPLAVPPQVAPTSDGVAVALDLTGLPRGDMAMALSAVIEEAGGTKSYWSLAHPPGAPDFHHAACFAARLPPPDVS
ncbi:DOMON-like domain-containing protein [Sphingomonas sp.]|uniref:DOMON-like domain-containing protein n=1 Tax=Sphingomonas sp. TaxID=28214 RepID=UPI003CC59D5E